MRETQMRFFTQSHVAVVQISVIPIPFLCVMAYRIGIVVVAKSSIDVWIYLMEPPVYDPPNSATHLYTCTQSQIKFNFRCQIFRIFHRRTSCSFLFCSQLWCIYWLFNPVAVFKFCLMGAIKSNCYITFCSFVCGFSCLNQLQIFCLHKFLTSSDAFLLLEKKGLTSSFLLLLCVQKPYGRRWKINGNLTSDRKPFAVYNTQRYLIWIIT